MDFRIGDRVKVKSGFSVGSIGTIVAIQYDPERPYDYFVKRDAAGNNDRMGYYGAELILHSADNYQMDRERLSKINSLAREMYIHVCAGANNLGDCTEEELAEAFEPAVDVIYKLSTLWVDRFERKS